jgi:hypothetical protein
MEITNLRIYDMYESIVASGLPMMAEYNEKWIADEIKNLAECEDITENLHFKRACKLAANPPGSGHNNWHTGVVVSCDVTAAVKWWEQFQRYHFKQIVSSMSTMHRLRKMALEGTLQFNSLTNPDIVKDFVRLAKDETVTDEELAYACPMGLMLTARVTTNYLQLRTQYQQRKHHKLKEWHDYCNFIENLPYAKEFIVGE